MPKYKVTAPFCGRIRGYREFIVLATSKEEAVQRAMDYDFISESYETISDDTDTDWYDVEAEEVQ